MGATEILIIRHGETGHNARRVLQPPEVPLSERGWQQARLLAARLAEEGVGRIVSSDLARAAMTARAVQEATSAELLFDPLLQERNFGDLRGTAYADLAESPFAPGYQPPGGESEAVFVARVALAWEQILHHAEATPAGGRLAVVTHGLVCRGLVADHLEPGDAEPASAWANTCLSVARGPSPWRVELVACAAHLPPELSPEGGRA